MVKEIKGDLLKAGTYYIAHQVNCRGKMGAGVAYQIRRHVLGERGYNDYRAVCRHEDGCGERTVEAPEKVFEPKGGDDA